MEILCIGDVMIPGKEIAIAAQGLNINSNNIAIDDWEMDWTKLQDRRLIIEKEGPAAEPIVPQILKANKDTEMLLVLFCPVSEDAIKVLPNLKLIGACRAGLENINIDYATRKGIIVHNIKGRNAHAVSDFAIGLMLSEARNIARGFHAMKKGIWQKKYINSEMIPELQGKTIGLIGFGYIGQLVARKLTGFQVNTLAYDPFVSEEIIKKHNVTQVDLPTLMKESDFISLHARLSKETENLISEKELSLMKESAYIVNTARAGLIDENSLFEVLKNKKIAGAALDVFWQEPIRDNNPWLTLDNITLTPHVAGTTREALTKSPHLLIEDINKLLNGTNPQFIVNPEVLENKDTIKWLEKIRERSF